MKLKAGPGHVVPLTSRYRQLTHLSIYLAVKPQSTIWHMPTLLGTLCSSVTVTLSVYVSLKLNNKLAFAFPQELNTFKTIFTVTTISFKFEKTKMRLLLSVPQYWDQCHHFCTVLPHSHCDALFLGPISYTFPVLNNFSHF